MDDFSLARPAGHLIMGDGSGPDGLAKKDGAKALSRAASVDTATTQVDKSSRTKNLITEYDGHRVTYHYRSHRTERMEHETVEVNTFIGRMVQHTMPKGFKRIRYYGVQATRTFAKVKALIREAVAKVEGVIKGAVKIIARLTYRQRYEQSTGRDPLRCPHCQSTMDVWRIWHPTYGVIYDEGEVIKRGTYTSTAPRAGP
jgi:hypothetical protein